MRGEEQATARPLFSAEASQGENAQSGYASPQEEPWPEPPSPPNAFTPISVAQRLRQPPRHSAHHQSPLPPMRPGQRYSYGSFEPQEAEPPPPPSTPYPPPLSFPGQRNQEAEDLRQYQQDYWSQLQNHTQETVHSQEGLGSSPPLIPDYLRDPAALPPLPPTAPRTVWDEGFPLPLEEELPEEWPPLQWEQAGMATEEWRPEDVVYSAFGGEEPEGPLWESQEWTALPPPSPLDVPLEPPGGPRPESAGLRLMRMLHQAFAVGPSPERSKGRLFQTISISLLSLMLAFCLLQVGRIVLSLLQNDEEMKAVREEYYALAGVELVRDASRVDLLPLGETFVPTATPEAVETSPPIAPEGLTLMGAASGQQGQASGEDNPAPTASPRTKATQYPDNPLKTVSEAFIKLRQENGDIVGHLAIEGLVDETVVMRNNTYYLTHNANGSYSETGAIFVDEACSLKTPPENLLLRGQSTVAGKLLEPLWNYATQGAEFVRKHVFLRMDTLYEEGEYVVFAVIVTSSQVSAPGYFNYAGYPSFPSDGQMESYVATAKALSLYEIPVEVRTSDRLLTISTLGGGPGGATLVLMARKLRQGETATSHLLALQSIQAK